MPEVKLDLALDLVATVDVVSSSDHISLQSLVIIQKLVTCLPDTVQGHDIGLLPITAAKGEPE